MASRRELGAGELEVELVPGLSAEQRKAEREHKLIAAAIRKRDAELVTELMRAHDAATIYGNALKVAPPPAHWPAALRSQLQHARAIVDARQSDHFRLLFGTAA